jgi:hypothetical protein
MREHFRATSYSITPPPWDADATMTAWLRCDLP